MTQKLILIRGLPGSGKSTLAKQLARDLEMEHIEADMFFISVDGVYQFVATNLPAAHKWCEQQTEQLLTQGASVIVANTFVQYWEMRAYIQIARKLKIKLEVIHCVGEYKNIHHVNNDVLTRMRQKWEACHWLPQKQYS